MPPISSTLSESGGDENTNEIATKNNNSNIVQDSPAIQAAFQVINDDIDPTPTTIPTTNKIKPLPTQSLIKSEKPNVVVYPTRRIIPPQRSPNGGSNLEEQRQKNFTRSNGYIYTQTRNVLTKNYSQSYSNINKNDFTKSLDAKLRKLQENDSPDPKQRSATSIKNVTNTKRNDDIERKPFVTVVKKGTFLRPPPVIAQKLLLEPEPDDAGRNEKVHIAKKLYAYVSRPKVLNRSADDTNNSRRGVVPTSGDKLGHKDSAHKARCDAAVKGAAMIAASVAGLARVKRDTNGDWKISHTDGNTANIMFDKRVHRGNTYAIQPTPCPKWNPYCGNAKCLSQGFGDEETLAARAAEARRRQMCRQKAKDRKAYGVRLRLGSPPPIKGRKHEPVQTELYLEEIMDHPPVSDTTTQTDLFLERPKSPFYYPAKVGIDAATQIYPGDLFDFDIEVQPILEILVGKTVEQALIEVLEEEELEALREQQRQFEEIRNAECTEAQRLEERERRYRQEKDRRIAEHEAGAQAQKETEERVAAAVLMQGYIADLLPTVLEGLKDDGFIIDNMKTSVDENFMPWLMKEVSVEMENMISSRDVLSDIVKEILETRHELYKAIGEAEDAEEEDPTLSTWAEEEDDENETFEEGATKE
ncbi:uncharacterized protein LOC123305746 isoform X2 [Chrysoperla carnea]|uniref:uncharacterized protein LOC123305746 isoform X2 n=1 Tax=Chrysoperla carnea TaxID=189513 RepID=UPI001D08E33E|nr:uncharacterized protein LOC123305746 isoform X2 [Chrysoperla carnea]